MCGQIDTYILYKYSWYLPKRLIDMSVRGSYRSSRAFGVRVCNFLRSTDIGHNIATQ